MRTTRTQRWAAATSALLLLALGACSSADQGGASDATAPASAEAEPAPSDEALRPSRTVDGTLVDEAEGEDSVQAGRPDVQTRAVISTGTVTLVDKDLSRVRGEIDRLLGRYGGYVSDEATFNDVAGETSGSRLTLRVPSAAFGTVMAAFGEITKVKDTKVSAEDVTTEVIDVDSRVKTQELSLERLRTFLGRTQDVNAMIRLESEIAQRESQLESLKAQQKYLAGQTSLGTITVTLQTPETAKKEQDDSGFLPGLSDGWNALQDSLTVVATGVGAVLPFAGLVALFGVPLWLVLRRRTTGAQPVVEPDGLS